MFLLPWGLSLFKWLFCGCFQVLDTYSIRTTLSRVLVTYAPPHATGGFLPSFCNWSWFLDVLLTNDRQAQQTLSILHHKCHTWRFTIHLLQLRFPFYFSSWLLTSVLLAFSKLPYIFLSFHHSWLQIVIHIFCLCSHKRYWIVCVMGSKAYQFFPQDCLKFNLTHFQSQF